MPHPALRYRIRLRRKNLEAAIELKGISVDDFGIELFGKLDRERSLPDRSRTNDKEGFVHDVDRLFIGQPYQGPALNSKTKSGDGLEATSPD